MNPKYFVKDVVELCDWYAEQDFESYWLLSKAYMNLLFKSYDFNELRYMSLDTYVEPGSYEFYMLHRISVLRCMSKVLMIKWEEGNQVLLSERLMQPISTVPFLGWNVIDFLLLNNNFSGFYAVQKYLNYILVIKLNLADSEVIKKG